MKDKKLSWSERLVLLTLQRNGFSMAGKEICEEIMDPHIWYGNKIPKQPSTIYRAIKKLKERGFIKEDESKREDIRGTTKRFWELTDKGKMISGYLKPSEFEFYKELIFFPGELFCSECDKNSPKCEGYKNLEECWKSWVEALANLFEEQFGQKPILDDKNIEKIKESFKYPGNIMTFISQMWIYNEIEKAWSESGFSYIMVWEYLKKKSLPHPDIAGDLLELIKEKPISLEDIPLYFKEKYNDLIPDWHYIIGIMQGFLTSGVVVQESDKFYISGENIPNSSDDGSRTFS